MLGPRLVELFGKVRRLGFGGAGFKAISIPISSLCLALGNQDVGAHQLLQCCACAAMFPTVMVMDSNPLES